MTKSKIGEILERMEDFYDSDENIDLLIQFFSETCDLKPDSDESREAYLERVTMLVKNNKLNITGLPEPKKAILIDDLIESDNNGDLDLSIFEKVVPPPVEAVTVPEVTADNDEAETGVTQDAPDLGLKWTTLNFKSLEGAVKRLMSDNGKQNKDVYKELLMKSIITYLSYGDSGADIDGTTQLDAVLQYAMILKNK